MLLGRVTDIDIAAKTVTSLSPVGTTVTPYDTLIVAAGAGSRISATISFRKLLRA